MSKFSLVRLENDAIKIIDGDRGTNYPQKADFQKNGHCVFLNTGNITKTGFDFSSADFISKGKDALLRKGKASRKDIVLTTRGTVGNVAFYGDSIPFENIRINSGMVLIRTIQTEIDPYYLYTFLRSGIFKKQVFLNGSGSAQPQLPITALKNIVFPLPKIETQKKIAAVLSCLDAKIDCNNQINAQLEAMAKTLYDYWFVQFDFPDTTGKPYKSSGGKMVYNTTLKREIPVGWKVRQLGEVVETTLGGTPATKNKEYWDNADLAWLSSSEIANFPVIDSDQRITPKGIKNSAAVLLPRGSVVVSIVRYIRPSILGIDAATNQSVVGILENDLFKHSFLYPFLCGEVTRLMGLRTGAQQPHINKGTIEETLIVIPNSDVLERYYKTAGPIFDGIMTRAFENHHLTQLRDWLLPMLMNGQVTVA